MTIKKKFRQFNHNVGWTLSLEVELKKIHAISLRLRPLGT